MRRRVESEAETSVVARPTGRRVFDHERPELWSDEKNRRRAERRFWVYALVAGPNDFNGRTDEELRAAFDDWGRESGVWDPGSGEPTGVWPETTWAFQRYIRGLTADDARTALAAAEERRDAAELAARLLVKNAPAVEEES